VSLAVLLDEHMPRDVADGLRRAGHDVWTIATVAAGIDDHGVLALARSSRRWLLTFDSDFGDLIYKRGAAPPPAVLYFRVRPVVATDVLALALTALTAANAGHFCVIAPEGIRRRPLPAVATDAGV
jgi:predicted nuclease of predicted toxin-antitoxin system